MKIWVKVISVCGKEKPNESNRYADHLISVDRSSFKEILQNAYIDVGAANERMGHSQRQILLALNENHSIQGK